MNQYVKNIFTVVFGNLLFAAVLAGGLVWWILQKPTDLTWIFTGIGIFLAILFVVVFSTVMFLRKNMNGYSKKEQRIIETGTRADAEIKNIQETGVVVNHIHPLVKMTILVNPSGMGDSFEAQIETIMSLVQAPRRGDIVQVAYDPSDKNNVVLIKQTPGKSRS